MSVLGWVVLAVAAWCAVAVVVALVVGRVIRLRDRQVPQADEHVTGIPIQRCASDPVLDLDSEVGNPEARGR